MIIFLKSRKENNHNVAYAALWYKWGLGSITNCGAA